MILQRQDDESTDDFLKRIVDEANIDINNLTYDIEDSKKLSFEGGPGIIIQDDRSWNNSLTISSDNNIPTLVQIDEIREELKEIKRVNDLLATYIMENLPHNKRKKNGKS